MTSIYYSNIFSSLTEKEESTYNFKFRLLDSGCWIITSLILAWFCCTSPLFLLLPSIFWTYQFVVGGLGVNPIEKLMHNFGEFALRLIIVTLLISSLAQFKYLRSLQMVRRMIGLYAFYYVLLHWWPFYRRIIKLLAVLHSRVISSILCLLHQPSELTWAPAVERKWWVWLGSFSQVSR